MEEEYEDVYKKISNNYMELCKYFLMCRNFLNDKEDNKKNLVLKYKTRFYKELQELYFNATSKRYCSFTFEWKIEKFIRPYKKEMFELINYVQKNYKLFEGEISDEFGVDMGF